MRCSVVTDRQTGDTIIIDGGDEPQRIIDWIDRFEGPGPNWTTGPESKEEANHLPARTVVALVNTHAHFDHSGFIPVLQGHYGVQWYLHPDDAFLQTLAQQSGRRYGLQLPEPAVADCDFEAGKTYAFGSIELSVLHTPGHTLGGCCLLIPVHRQLWRRFLLARSINSHPTLASRTRYSRASWSWPVDHDWARTPDKPIRGRCRRRRRHVRFWQVCLISSSCP